MTGLLDRSDQALQALDARGRRRVLAPRDGHDFASNDYLGLATSPRLGAAVAAAIGRGVPVGAAGSRLLRGNHPEHEALEEEAARLFGAPRALYFGSGYAANMAIFSALPQPGDLIVYDALSHASTREGIRAGRAEAVAARHNDADDFAAQVSQWRARGGRGVPWLAVESLYSMDGDRAPLAELDAVARQHDGVLVVDEAHATGVLGPGGLGLAAGLEHGPHLVVLHTCGKALGASGALVTAATPLVDLLVNRARQFIFATAPSPLMAAAVREALRILVDEPQRRRQLDALVDHAGQLFAGRLGVPPSGSQIIPVILGEDGRAVRAAQALRRAGFDCRAIRPPTVPEGTARLRVSLTLNVDPPVVDALVATLAALDRS
ncbi:8-amino-7-oxononanoate synthase [Zavarzinia sp. CC-PAN008]|uniref:8-amino-7-oxononanoate synthase n=1 Tax=Zavarzinia sp. CC-PAN008 TaxID=3243332 RepID=UPI003F743005